MNCNFCKENNDNNNCSAIDGCSVAHNCLLCRGVHVYPADSMGAIRNGISCDRGYPMRWVQKTNIFRRICKLTNEPVGCRDYVGFDKA